MMEKLSSLILGKQVIIAPVICPACQGQKQLWCEGCLSLRLAPNCAGCQGRRRIDCRRCKGRGWIECNATHPAE